MNIFVMILKVMILTMIMIQIINDLDYFNKNQYLYDLYLINIENHHILSVRYDWETHFEPNERLRLHNENL